MATVRKYQNNFIAGAISPSAYARTDLQKYSSGCKEIVNGIVRPHGGVSKRPGTLFLGSLPGDAFLFPFAYNTEQTYVLCFHAGSEGEEGAAYLTVYQGGASVVANVATPYLVSELPILKFAQSADVLFLAHPAHPPMKLTRYSATDWRFEKMEFVPKIPAPKNLVGVTYLYNMADTYNWSDIDTTIDYKVSAVSADEEESDTSEETSVNMVATWPKKGRVHLAWDPVPGAVRYEVYKKTAGYYVWIGSSDNCRFVDDNIEGDAKLGPKTYRDPFNPIVVGEFEFSVSGESASTDSLDLCLTVVNAGGAESLVPESGYQVLDNVWYGDTVTWTWSEAAGTSGGKPETFNIYIRPHGTEEPWAMMPVPTETTQVVTGTGSDKKVLYQGTVKATNQIAGPSGNYPFTRCIGGTVSIAANTATSLPDPSSLRQSDPPETHRTYPGAVGLYQQRLVYGRSDMEPQTVWLSETGSFNSMAVANPQQDDNAITATMDSRQMNEIRHFVPLRDMLVMTSGAEFVMSSGSAEALTPFTISFRPQSYWGCSHVPPIVTGLSVIFVDNSGRKVRDMEYRIEADGFSGTEVSILAEHLITSPVRDWTYQMAPWNSAWVVLEDGKLLTLTYLKEQDVLAWSEHESSGGKFRSVCCVREGEHDVVYFVVDRGGTYYLERQKLRDYGDPAEDSLFLDCATEYSSSLGTLTRLTGLSRFAGKDITLLVDGSAVRNVRVAPGGTVDLPGPCYKAKAGLPYTARIATLDPEVTTQEGATTGLKKTVPCVTLSLRETVGMRVGVPVTVLGEDGLFKPELRTTEVKFPVPARYGDPYPLYTGTLNVTVPGAHRDEATVVLESYDPYPMTVLGIVTTVSVG